MTALMVRRCPECGTPSQGDFRACGWCAIFGFSKLMEAPAVDLPPLPVGTGPRASDAWMADHAYEFESRIGDFPATG